MENPLPESTWKRIAFAGGAVVGFFVLSLVVFPVALLAVEYVAGIVTAVISTITEPRRGRRPA
ncbi:hypothetical protein [Haladaptatus sp. NG-WS-4]